MKDPLQRIMEGESVDSVIKSEISQRRCTGKLLAEKFPELKGLSYEQFLLKLPLELDFITGCEMFKALNKT